MPAKITGGDRETQSHGYYLIPKRDLITGLQVLLERGGLEIAARLKHGAALAAELTAMQVRVTPAGNEQYGAWREGSHDDMVFAALVADFQTTAVPGIPTELKGVD